MAEKISIEVGLDGGQEVQRQLEELGSTGQKAFGDLQSAAEGVDLSSVASQVNDATQAVKQATQIEQVAQVFKRVEDAFNSLGNAAVRMGSRMTRALGPLGVAVRAFGPLGIAAGLAGGAFIKFGNDAERSITALTAASAKLGLTETQLDQLTKGLASFGISSEAISSGLTKVEETAAASGRNIGSTLEGIIAQLARMPDSVQRTQQAISQLGEGFGTQIIAGLRTGEIGVEQLKTAIAGVQPIKPEQIIQAAEFDQARNRLSAAWTEFKNEVATPILTPVFQFLTTELQKLAAAAKEVAALFRAINAIRITIGAPLAEQAAAAQRAAEAWAEFRRIEAENVRRFSEGAQQNTQNADATASSLRQMGIAAQSAGQQVAQGMSAATQATAQLGAASEEAASQNSGFINAALMVGNYTEALLRAIAVMERLANAARFIANLPRPTTIPSLEESRPAPIGPGLAGGGLLGGRGTGTSDSNLAWLSRGEYVTPARAVAQPGVLAFLEALRRSGGDLRGVLDGLRGFALGGLVPRTMPAFAAGGAVGRMSNVTIAFPGVPPVTGLRASSTVVSELERAAAMAQVRSGGRKPSRYS